MSGLEVMISDVMRIICAIRNPIRIAVGVAASLLVGTTLVAQEPPATPTWSSDVAAIVYRSCAPCHRPGQPAPFSLLSYQDFFKKREFALELIESRYMPPWQPTHGEFVGDRRLSEPEIATIRRWLAAGAPRGDAANEPAAPQFGSGWQLGEPDAIVRMPDVLNVPAAGPDIVRNFVVPVALERMRFVAAIEIRPGNPAVHHAVLAVDRSRRSRQADALDVQPGFPGMAPWDAVPPDGHFLGWTPGKSVERNSDGMAWRLYPNDDLVLQLHAVPVGKAEQVQPEIGIWFTDVPTQRVLYLVTLFSERIDVAPGVADFVLQDHLVLPVPVTLHAVYPHAHNICRRMRGTVTTPDGKEQVLFAIEHWDFDWQDDYRFKTPLELPAGARLAIEYVYDNSEQNPNNTQRPLRRVQFGQESADEMGTATFSLILQDERDRPKLLMAAVSRDLEKLPKAWNLLLRKGQLLREQGDLTAAAPLIEQACGISPGAAAVWLERGILAEARNELPRAVESYQRALSIDPQHGMAHLQLGTLYGRSGNQKLALQHFADAVAALPNSARAQNNFATASFAAEQLDVAERHYRRAIALAPDYFNAQFNLARVLLQLGRTQAAKKELQRAAELRPGEPAVQQLLRQLENGK